MSNFIKCNQAQCFANRCGTLCSALNKPYFDKPCPFFKTIEQNEADKRRAHDRLEKIGASNLINKYEYNDSRAGSW